MIHIKPTADKADAHQFRANLIRFYHEIKSGKDKDSFRALTENIFSQDTGIHETVRTASEAVREIIGRHSDACRLEVVAYLEHVARQLRIEL